MHKSIRDAYNKYKTRKMDENLTAAQPAAKKKKKRRHQREGPKCLKKQIQRREKFLRKEESLAADEVKVDKQISASENGSAP